MNILRNNRLSQLCARSWTQNYSHTNSQKKLVIEALDQRQLVRVKGEDVISFLQGLTTSDMRLLQSPPNGPLYTMFLNKAGRVLYDAIIYRSSSDQSAILIECDKDISNELMRHLKLYRVRRKIQIDNVMEEFKVWSVFEPFTESSKTTACNIQKPENSNDIEIAHDPRLLELGHRVITSCDKTSSELSKLYTKITDVVVDAPSQSLNYRLHRYCLGVAEGVQDMPPGKQFPLEANCDLLNGVSFNKGCYIGQELTARVHHTGVIRKRHMPVLLPAPLSVNSTRDIYKEGGGGAKVGTILGSADNRALGLLRVEQVLNSKELVLDGKPCYTEKPKWWPPTLLSNVTIREGV